MQGDDRLAAVAQHEDGKFIVDRFDIAKAHLHLRPVTDNALDVRRPLRRGEIGRKGEHQRDVRRNLSGKRIVQCPESLYFAAGR